MGVVHCQIFHFNLTVTCFLSDFTLIPLLAVREKSKQLVLLLKDQERLGYERSKAIKV